MNSLERLNNLVFNDDYIVNDHIDPIAHKNFFVFIFEGQRKLTFHPQIHMS